MAFMIEHISKSREYLFKYQILWTKISRSKSTVLPYRDGNFLPVVGNCLCEFEEWNVAYKGTQRPIGNSSLGVDGVVVALQLSVIMSYTRVVIVSLQCCCNSVVYIVHRDCVSRFSVLL